MVTNEGLKGVAEDAFDDKYLPADEVDGVLETADDTSNDVQVPRKIAVDISRRNRASIQMITIMWPLFESRSI